MREGRYITVPGFAGHYAELLAVGRPPINETFCIDLDHQPSPLRCATTRQWSSSPFKRGGTYLQPLPIRFAEFNNFTRLPITRLLKKISH